MEDQSVRYAGSKAPKDVACNKKYPPEFFDRIIVGECRDPCGRRIQNGQTEPLLIELPDAVRQIGGIHAGKIAEDHLRSGILLKICSDK